MQNDSNHQLVTSLRVKLAGACCIESMVAAIVRIVAAIIVAREEDQSISGCSCDTAQQSASIMDDDHNSDVIRLSQDTLPDLSYQCDGALACY